MAARSRDWLIRAPEILWERTKGVVSQESLTAFRDYVVDTWAARESHRKLLQFAAAFLKHVSKTTFDPQFQAYTVFLERPRHRTPKPKKQLVFSLRRLLGRKAGKSLTVSTFLSVALGDACVRLNTRIFRHHSLA